MTGRPAQPGLQWLKRFEKPARVVDCDRQWAAINGAYRRGLVSMRPLAKGVAEVALTDAGRAELVPAEAADGA